MNVPLARWPAAALVDALRGRTIVEAYCDGEGMDDVQLRLDDGTHVWLDVDVEDTSRNLPGAGRLDLGPRGRLRVAVQHSEPGRSRGPSAPEPSG